MFLLVGFLVGQSILIIARRHGIDFFHYEKFYKDRPGGEASDFGFP
jgi:hypothetical protein